MRNWIIALFVSLMTVGSLHAQEPTPTPAPAGPTLNSIRARGELLCGVNQDVYGFGFLDPNTGDVTGFQVTLCRALAAALFGDPAAAQMVIHSTREQALAALAAGELDVLLRDETETLSLDSSGYQFGPVVFYSGQGMLIRSDGPADWEALNDQTVCVTSGSVAEEALPFAMRSRGLGVQLLPLESDAAAWEALQEGRCDAQSANRVPLAIQRQRADDPTSYTVWEDVLYTREPIAPLLRAGDDQWADIVRWTMYGLLTAERLNLSSAVVNTLVRQELGTDSSGRPLLEVDADYVARVGPEVSRLLDATLGSGRPLGLQANFMLPVLQTVGHYGEIVERHFGVNSVLPLPRGVNALVEAGGWLYAPDWR
jgi:general L-amino acid transport system substrate-binding protein